jgi:KDO2-lipid IV(A) lauroyltransferase
MDELAERIATIERPQAHLLQATRQSLWVRIYGSPALHKLVPTAVALRLAAVRGLAEWYLLRRRREEALGRIGALLRTPRDAQRTRTAARAHVVDEAVRAELQWRPWLARAMEIEGLEHLEAAQSKGRGVILATAHIGPVLALVHALAARGVKLYLSGGHRLGEPGLDGRLGRWVVAQNRWVEEVGCRWVRKPGSYAALRELLRRGECVWMGADAVGVSTTRLAGHRVSVASGVARLAVETGASIVPAFALRRGYRQVGVLHPALDGSGDSQVLLDRLAHELGEVILAHPAQAHLNLFQLIGARR